MLCWDWIITALLRFFERKEIKDVLSYVRLALNPDSTSDLERVINVPKRGIGKVTLLKILSGKQSELNLKTRERVNEFWKLVKTIRVKIDEEKPSEVIKFIFKETGMKSFLESGSDDDLERALNIKELVTFALGYDEMPLGEGIEKLLENAALASDQDSLSKDKNGVSCPSRRFLLS